MRFERRVWFFVCAAMAACGGETSVEPASPDVGADGGSPDVASPDASSAGEVAAPDGAVAPDAAASADVATPPDVSVTPDVATPPDASPDVAPPPDAAAASEGVRVVREGCDGPAGPLPGTVCRTLEVRCGGLAPVQVALRVTPPAAGAPARGVVVFGSGGGGTGLWSGPASADAMMGRLAAAGFTVIEREWLVAREQGWFYDAAGRGVPAAACRYTTLLRFVDATYRRGSQPLCATGNSGGSAELGYALTRQNAGDLLDLAVPSSGPFHRADLACGADDTAWQAECRSLARRHCPTCATSGCSLGAGARQLIDASYGSASPCTGTRTPLDGARLRPDSPVAAGATLRLPRTRVALLVGEQDPGPYGALSAALYEALRAAGADVTFGTEATGHEFQSTDAGARRIERVILADCVRRH